MADATIVIARPIGDVFTVLTDPEQTARWFPVPVREQWISPPPHGVGSTRRAWVRMLGRETANEAVVTEYEPSRRAALEVRASGMLLTVRLRFEPAEGGARVLVYFVSGSRGIGRLVMSVFLGWYRRQWQRGLATLKSMMEAGEL